MINSKLSQLSIILLIAIFSIVACSGGAESIAGSRTAPTEDLPPVEEPPIDEPTDEPVVDGGKWDISETPGHEYFGSSYRTVYLRGASPTPWIRVSYNDTDRLTRMWKWTIDGEKRDGLRRKYIKSHDGDFFFDENYNIRWSKKPDVVLKWFQGGAIVQLREGQGNNYFSSTEEQRGGARFSGSWTIGGLYTYAMHLSEATRLNSDSVNQFFGAESEFRRDGKGRQDFFLHGARMEILVLHPGYPLDKGTGKYKGLWAGSRPGQGWTGEEAWAAQSYMAYPSSGYADGNHHIWNIKGNSPERYTPHMKTYQLYHSYFRWVVDEAYNPATFTRVTEEAATVSTDTEARVNLKDIIIK